MYNTVIINTASSYTVPLGGIPYIVLGLSVAKLTIHGTPRRSR